MDTKKLTINEAAQRAGVEPETVRRWVRSGKLAAEKVALGLSKVWMVDQEQLDNLVPNKKITATLSAAKIFFGDQRVEGTPEDYMALSQVGELWNLELVLHQGSPAIATVLGHLPQDDKELHPPVPIRINVMGNFAFEGDGYFTSLGDWGVTDQGLARTIKMGLRSKPQQTKAIVNLDVKAAKFLVGPEMVRLEGAAEDYFQMTEPLGVFQVCIEAPGQTMPRIGAMIRIPLKEPVGTVLCEVKSIEGSKIKGEVSIYHQGTFDALQALLDRLSPTKAGPMA